jgi:hypothetical protein
MLPHTCNQVPYCPLITFQIPASLSSMQVTIVDQKTTACDTSDALSSIGMGGNEASRCAFLSLLPLCRRRGMTMTRKKIGARDRHCPVGFCISLSRHSSSQGTRHRPLCAHPTIVLLHFYIIFLNARERPGTMVDIRMRRMDAILTKELPLVHPTRDSPPPPTKLLKKNEDEKNSRRSIP